MVGVETNELRNRKNSPLGLYDSFYVAPRLLF